MAEKPYILTTPGGEEYDIPVEGSLGLLALGDVGLTAWREKIERLKREMAARGHTAQEPEDRNPNQSQE